jgi:hypothetical protein
MMMATFNLGDRVAEVRNFKPSKRWGTTKSSQYIRVGEVIELHGERVRVKWLYEKRNDEQPTAMKKNLRTFFQVKRLVPAPFGLARDGVQSAG